LSIKMIFILIVIPEPKWPCVCGIIVYWSDGISIHRMSKNTNTKKSQPSSLMHVTRTFLGSFKILT